MKRIIYVLIALLLVTCNSGVDQKQQANSKVKYVGARSSSYGIRPFPRPEEWSSAMGKFNKSFQKAEPCAIWIVGVLHDDRTSCRLEFPAPEGKTYKNIVFQNVDKHEEYLNYFDQNGIKVFLQVEPADGDIVELIDIVLNRYKHHSCVVGYGVDVEWFQENSNREWGAKVTDEFAEVWEKAVKKHNHNYKLFLKHWDRNWMPPKYRGELVFVSDSQQFPSLDSAVTEFTEYWAEHFKPNPVYFQYGYGSDRKWWGKFDNPPVDFANILNDKIDQEIGFFWVDFTLRQTLLKEDK